MSQYSRSKSDDLYVNLRLAQDFFYLSLHVSQILGIKLFSDDARMALNEYIWIPWQS